jgi:hypothetical protein
LAGDVVLYFHNWWLVVGLWSLESSILPRPNY